MFFNYLIHYEVSYCAIKIDKKHNINALDLNKYGNVK